MLTGYQVKRVRTRPSPLGPDQKYDTSSLDLEFRVRTCSDASRASSRHTSWLPNPELTVPRVCSTGNICKVCATAGESTNKPPMPWSNVPCKCAHLGNLLDKIQPNRPTGRPDLHDPGCRACSSSRDTRQLLWLRSVHCCRWRHSDPYLAGPSFHKPEIASSSSLPVCDCHGYIGPGDKGTLNSPETHTFPKCGSKHEQTPNRASPHENIVVSADFERQRLGCEMDYLYDGPAHPHKPFTLSGPVTWSASTPDLRIDYPHLNDVDSGSDDSHDHTQCEPDRHDTRLSKLSKIFSNILSDQHLGGPQRHAGQYDPLERRCSMDSQILYKSRSQTVRPVSRRTIKISCPGHANTMFISGVDTLGGLPDSEDLNKGPSSDGRFLVSDSSRSHELNLYSHQRRRSSCPVIFESEESRECTSPRKLGSQELETNSYSSVSSFSSSEELGPSQSSRELGPSQSSREPKFSGNSSQFFLGSAPLKTPGSTKKSSSRQLLAGVTFIVDRQPTTSGELGAEVSRDAGSNCDVIAPTCQQTGNRKWAQSIQSRSLGDKSGIQDLTKSDTLVMKPGSRTASVSRSRPTSGRSSPSSRPMSRACTDSSSSSLTVDEDGPGQHSAQSSATSSADDIA